MLPIALPRRGRLKAAGCTCDGAPLDSKERDHIDECLAFRHMTSANA